MIPEGKPEGVDWQDLPVGAQYQGSCTIPPVNTKRAFLEGVETVEHVGQDGVLDLGHVGASFCFIWDTLRISASPKEITKVGNLTMASNDFYNLQLQKTFEILEDYWKSIINLQNKSDLDKRDVDNFVPWFGALECWLTELKEVNYDTYPEFDLSASKIYPKAICDKAGIRNIAKELDLLLPKDNPAICDILPVLITAYIVNRRSPTGEKGVADSAVDYQGTPGFVNFLLDSTGPKLTIADKKAGRKAPQKVIDPRKMLQSKEKLFLLKNWNDSFPKITYSQVTKRKAQMLLSGYGCIRLFFFLLYKLQDKCNVSLSCFMFESMTGYGEWTINGEEISQKEDILSDSRRSHILTYVKKDFNDLFDTVNTSMDDEDELKSAFIDLLEVTYDEKGLNGESLFSWFLKNSSVKDLADRINISSKEDSIKTDFIEKEICSWLKNFEPMNVGLPMSMYKYLYAIKEALIEREEKERGKPLSEEEIKAGYKLFADLDFIFGVQDSRPPLSDFLDNDFLEPIMKDLEDTNEIEQK